MAVQKYLERIRYIDNLIRTKATGSATQLAKKLALSERTVLEHIKIMKELGCPIKYCRKRNSYYYNQEGKVIISFFEDQLKDSTAIGDKNIL
jgi:biotin operon repressor